MSKTAPGPALARLLEVASASLFGVLATPVAHARLYDREPPRIELGVELSFPLYDADDSFADLTPTALFGVAAGVYVAPDLRAGFVLRAAISDPHAEHYEVLSDLTWSWVDEPRLPDPPALRVALSLSLGWHFSELVGSDFVLTDQGLTASLGGELGLVLFDDVSLSLGLAVVSASASNTSLEAWSPKLRLGVSLATLF